MLTQLPKSTDHEIDVCGFNWEDIVTRRPIFNRVIDRVCNPL